MLWTIKEITRKQFEICWTLPRTSFYGKVTGFGLQLSWEKYWEFQKNLKKKQMWTIVSGTTQDWSLNSLFPQSICKYWNILLSFWGKPLPQMLIFHIILPFFGQKHPILKIFKTNTPSKFVTLPLHFGPIYPTQKALNLPIFLVLSQQLRVTAMGLEPTTTLLQGVPWHSGNYRV